MSFVVIPDQPENKDGKPIGPQVRSERTAAEAVKAYCKQMNCESATVEGSEVKVKPVKKTTNGPDA